ncbi:hypothetical protein HDU97_000223 [Phlyctochytrium planicorne]|nr:hypothetical protein HDU97_000223 [Phlyctochytrium planicorne]
MTKASFQKCLSVYAKSTWRGMRLKIAEAKPDFIERLNREREGVPTGLTQAQIERRQERRLKRSLALQLPCAALPGVFWAPKEAKEDNNGETDGEEKEKEKMPKKEGKPSGLLPLAVEKIVVGRSESNGKSLWWKHVRGGKMAPVVRVGIIKHGKKRTLTVDPVKFKYNHRRLEERMGQQGQQGREKSIAEIWRGLGLETFYASGLASKWDDDDNEPRSLKVLDSDPEDDISEPAPRPNQHPQLPLSSTQPSTQTLISQTQSKFQSQNPSHPLHKWWPINTPLPLAPVPVDPRDPTDPDSIAYLKAMARMGRVSKKTAMKGEKRRWEDDKLWGAKQVLVEEAEKGRIRYFTYAYEEGEQVDKEYVGFCLDSEDTQGNGLDQELRDEKECLMGILKGLVGTSGKKEKDKPNARKEEVEQKAEDGKEEAGREGGEEEKDEKEEAEKTAGGFGDGVHRSIMWKEPSRFDPGDEACADLLEEGDIGGLSIAQDAMDVDDHVEEVTEEAPGGNNADADIKPVVEEEPIAQSPKRQRSKSPEKKSEPSEQPKSTTLKEPEKAPKQKEPTPSKTSDTSEPTYQVNSNLRALVFGGAPAQPAPTADSSSFSLSSLFAPPLTSDAVPQDKVQSDDENMKGLTGDALRKRAGAGKGEGVLGTRTHFSLLGALGLEKDEEELKEEESGKGDAMGVDEPKELEAERDQGHAGGLFTQPKMFFFHFNDPELSKRSIYAPTFAFMRTSTLEDIQRNWEETRSELTAEYKRKHRSASRRVASRKPAFGGAGGKAGRSGGAQESIFGKYGLNKEAMGVK